MVVSPRQTWQWNSLALVLAFGFFSAVTLVNGRIGFEKLTEYEYRGNTYYTIRNLSLYECQGWCREEPECQAAVFSFVVNPVTPIQETVCRLQNETQAVNPSAVPTRAVARYNMIKLHIRTDNVCKRPWTFERVPNHMIAGLDNARVFTSTKEACLAACLNEKRFVCRSAEYNYESLQCLLSQHDRRAVDERVEFVEAQGVDYFENLCLKSENSCRGDKEYNIYKPAADKNSRLPQILPTQVAQYVDLHYYVDKELMTSNLEACKKACIIEEEFLCRSFMYKGPPQGTTYNCQLFHLDHNTYPDGDETYRNLDRPLMDDGERIGNYYENECIKPKNHMICSQKVSKDLRYLTQIMCYEKPVSRRTGGDSAHMARDTGPDAAYSSQYTSGPNSSGLLGGPAGTVGAGAGAGAGAAGGITAGYPAGPAGQQTGTVGIETGGAGGGAAGGSPAGLPATSKDPSTDVNCDSSGICYDVAVHCKDTRIVVEVNTNKPFNGRIYAMGRSETCNVNVIKSPRFRLDLTMSGQDCNTKSSTGGVYSNTVVIQHHNKVMTKTDKIYKVRCTYDTSSKNITFGMMPVGDPDMISITSAPEAPPPRIRILDANSREVETVKIGDRLTFRIDIPQDTPYGIFARSCVAMAKDARSTFQLIDDRGCPVDPSIFPRFLPDGLALVAYYDAFRFTESYGVIFQCNVRYCLGPCEPATCEWGSENYSSYGKRKRRSPGLTEVPQLLGPVSADRQGRSVKEATNEEDMTLSQELFVLDFGDDELQLQKQTNPDEASEGASGPRGDLSIGFGRSSGQSATGRENIAVFEVCPTRTSVLALAVTCALLLLIYICSLFYFLMRRWYVQKPMQ